MHLFAIKKNFRLKFVVLFTNENYPCYFGSPTQLNWYLRATFKKYIKYINNYHNIKIIILKLPVWEQLVESNFRWNKLHTRATSCRLLLLIVLYKTKTGMRLNKFEKYLQCLQMLVAFWDDMFAYALDSFGKRHWQYF